MIGPVRDFAAEARAEEEARRLKLDLVTYLERQSEFSLQAFGPGPRTAGVLAHIRKELGEIEREPADLFEWIDVATLAFDGALRAGWTPEQVAGALAAKLERNRARKWPDWRTKSQDEPIEHVRATEVPR
jgi:hypothetical protein